MPGAAGTPVLVRPASGPPSACVEGRVDLGDAGSGMGGGGGLDVVEGLSAHEEKEETRGRAALWPR